jgi:hypothetical protein
LISVASDRVDEEVSDHRNKFESFIKGTLELEPFVPEPILLTGFKYSMIKYGKICKEKIIDLDSIEDKREFIKLIFEEFVIGNEDKKLLRKDFEQYIEDKHNIKYKKRDLWNLTKSLGLKLKY